MIIAYDLSIKTWFDLSRNGDNIWISEEIIMIKN